MRKVEDDVGDVSRNEAESSKSEVGNRESQSRIFKSRESISKRLPLLYPDRSVRNLGSLEPLCHAPHSQPIIHTIPSSPNSCTRQNIIQERLKLLTNHNRHQP
jgi:hypothetical protein